MTRLPALALVGGPPLTAPLKLALHSRTSGEHLARGVFVGTMRVQNMEWLERCSLDRSCQCVLFGISVTGVPPFGNSERLLSGLRSDKMPRPHAAVGGCWDALDAAHAGGPLIWAGRTPAPRARSRRLGLGTPRAESSTRRALDADPSGTDV